MTNKMNSLLSIVTLSPKGDSVALEIATFGTEALISAVNAFLITLVEGYPSAYLLVEQLDQEQVRGLAIGNGWRCQTITRGQRPLVAVQLGTTSAPAEQAGGEQPVGEKKSKHFTAILTAVARLGAASNSTKA